MKKLILTAALASATALSGFSQGQINFQNALASQIWFNSTVAPGVKASTATVGSQTGTTSTGVIDVGLFWSTAAFTDSAQGTLADTVTMAATGAGDIQGTTVAIAAVAPGTQVFVQVFAWDSTYATPDAALAAGGYFGAASAGPLNTIYGAIGAAQLTSALTANPAPGAPIFGTAAGQFGRTVLLGSTPEPATIALGGLGAAALLMFRRKK
jgi:hypothetical protein